MQQQDQHRRSAMLPRLAHLLAFLCSLFFTLQSKPCFSQIPKLSNADSTSVDGAFTSSITHSGHGCYLDPKQKKEELTLSSIDSRNQHSKHKSLLQYCLCVLTLSSDLVPQDHSAKFYVENSDQFALLHANRLRASTVLLI